MNLKNCSRCSKVYVSSHPTLCPECLEADENAFKRVRDFVKDNPRVSIEVVVEATGVSEEQVREYVRQGRLDVASFSGPILECSRCGKPIESGQYCVLCLKELSQTFKSFQTQPAREEKEKRHSQFARYYRSKWEK